MSTPCEFHAHGLTARCSTCHLVVGHHSARDCPRAREPYGLGGAYDLGPAGASNVRLADTPSGAHVATSPGDLAHLPVSVGGAFLQACDRLEHSEAAEGEAQPAARFGATGGRTRFQVGGGHRQILI